MKKILYSLIAVLAMVISSCSNDDIEVIKTGGVTFNISSESVYDDFGIAERFKNEYLSGSHKIGVYTFVYNENETLVASDSTYVQTFTNIPQNFPKLKEGTYTYVVLEMLVNGDKDNTSDSWVIVGKEKLSTLEILNKNYLAWWQAAVGLSTGTIDISCNQNQSLTVYPKGIGSIIHSRMTNFDKSDYHYVAFLTKDQPKGRFLSPKYQGNDRFYYDKYLSSNTWASRGYAYNTKGELRNLELPYFYLLEEGTFRCIYGAKKLNEQGGFDTGFDSYGESTFTVEDGHSYYVGFNYQAKEWCPTGFFDSEQKYIDWYKTHHDATPYLSWGASAIVVDSYMKRDGMEFLENGMSEDHSLYYSVYSNNYRNLFYEYRFNVAKTKLASVLLTYSPDAYSFDEILSWLGKEYSGGSFVDIYGGYLFKSDVTTVLAVNQGERFVVLYVANSEMETLSQVVTDKLLFKSRKFK